MKTVSVSVMLCLGYSSRWDEWLKVGSPRIAAFKTKTNKGHTAFPLLNKWEQFQACAQSTSALMTKLLAQPSDVKSHLQAALSEEEQKFLIGENFTYVLNCLNATLSDETVQPALQNFLQLNLKVICHVLEHEEEASMPVPFWDLLARIFGTCRSMFYETYGLRVDGDGKYSTRASCLASAPSSPKQDKPNISGHLVANVNKFGEYNGFDLIRSRLTATCSLTLLERLTSTLAAVRPRLTDSFWAGYYASLGLEEFLTGRMRDMSDQELRAESKQTLSALVINMRVLQPDHNRVDSLELTIALRLLSAQVLEKKLNALDNIEAILLKCSSGEEEAKERSNKKREQATTASSQLVPEFLTEWLQEHGVVKLALGTSPHFQIITRTVPILKFLAKHKALTAEHVNETYHPYIYI